MTRKKSGEKDLPPLESSHVEMVLMSMSITVCILQDLCTRHGHENIAIGFKVSLTETKNNIHFLNIVKESNDDAVIL